MNIASSLNTTPAWNLFSRRDDDLTSYEVVKWWEVRRIPYNLIVGVTGIVTVLVGTFLCFVASRMTPAPFAFPNPPLFAVVAIVGYGVMANICFTGGWMAELLARKIWRENANHFAQISFTLGVLFSVLLTLTPALLLAALLVYRLVSPTH